MDTPHNLADRAVSARKPSLAVRIIRGLGWTSITVGVLILGFVVQQLFVTDILAEREQTALGEAADEYFDSAVVEDVEVVPGFGIVEPGGTPPPMEPGQTTMILRREASPDLGVAFATIRIPKIEKLKEGWTIVEGVRRSDLTTGAGHMPATSLPGQPGNAVISGHRTTYGAPFHNLDELVAGDRIEVDTAIGTHVYAVRELIVVKPTALWVTDPRPGAWLTLTTCHPKWAASERLIVFAELVDGPNAEVIKAIS